MAIEFRFQIDPDKICIQDGHTGYRLEVSNRVVYRRKDGLILSLGESSPPHLGVPYEAMAGELNSTALFGAEGTELPYEVRAMAHFTRLLHRQSQQARPVAHFLAKLGDGFDYVITISGYDDFSEDRRRTLEQYLQGHLRLRRLVMNGQEVQIPFWKRNLEFWMRRILFLVMPLLLMAVGYWTMPAALASNPLLFLGYLLGITYLFHYLGKILWMILTRWLVPGEYRLCMLQGTRPRLSGIDRRLARAFWNLP